MLEYVHISPKFNKRLNALKISEKMAVSAAKKTDEIIQNIISNGEAPLSILGKFTKHGEWRIKNCVKFDIGKGYRLVCVKENNHLFILYVGTHDDCDTWIENNRNYMPDYKKNKTIIHEVKSHENFDRESSVKSLNEPDYEDLILEKITEKDLRHVFCGLWG